MSSNDVEKAVQEVVLPLLHVPGSAETQRHTPDDSLRGAENPKTPDGQENNKFQSYRKLAIASIICGCSCIGCKALKYSFEAEHNKNKEKAEEAKKYSCISILTFWGILISIPLLIFLVSFLLTLAD